jgi:PAS domain S-box-containing protein
MRTIKTLTVSTETQTRELLESVLRSRGHMTAVCPERADVPSIFEKDRFNLILVDGTADEAADLEFLRTVRRDPRAEDALVLFITGETRPDFLQAVLEAGANDYLDRGELDASRFNLRIAVAEQRVINLKRRLRAGEDLHRSEVKFKTLVEELPAITYIAPIERPHSVLYVSPQIETLLGYTAQEWILDPDLFLRSVCDEDRDRVLSQAEQALAAPNPILSLEYRLTARNGEVLWFHDEASVVKDESGKRLFIQGVLIDITDRKKAEQTLEYRIEIERQISSMSARFIQIDESEIDRAINEALAAMGRFAGVDRSYVFLFNESGDRMDNTHEWCNTGIDPHIRRLKDLPMDQFPWYMERIRKLAPVHIPRVADLPPVAWAEKSEFESENILSLINVPMIYEGSLIGFVGFDSVRTEKTWLEEDIRLLTMVGDLFATAIGRRRYRTQAEAEKRDREQFLGSVLSAVPDVILVLDGEGRYCEVYTAGEELLYRPAKEMLGKTIHDVVPRELARAVQEVIDRTLQTGQPQPFEYPLETAGINRWFSARTVRFAWKEEARVLWVARDITQQKEAEAALQRSHENLAAILDQLHIGITMTDPDGRIVFISRSWQNLLGIDLGKTLGKHWESVCPFSPEDKSRINALLSLPPKKREKIQAHLSVPGGRHYWVEIEVDDDPRNPQRKIFCFYDRTEIYNLRTQLNKTAEFHDLIGKTEVMHQVYQQIRDVAGLDWTVLITGETGSGKELVARAIHSLSRRKDRPYIAVNCAGLTESLLTSQLFGHKRGAFTGAVADQKGLIEAADGGTLFLDEIGDVSMSVQTSLLRALETREITRLGETHPKTIDVRIIAATHRNLAQEVAQGRFRSDLLYRLRVARIELPNLRDRREDIPLLVDHFLREAHLSIGQPVKKIAHEAMQVLLRYDWPGNVRELKSAIDVAVIHSKGSLVQPGDLPYEITKAVQLQGSPEPELKDEKTRFTEALQKAHGNRTLAARNLGISRATFYRRLAELGLGPKRGAGRRFTR